MRKGESRKAGFQRAAKESLARAIRSVAEPAAKRCIADFAPFLQYRLQSKRNDLHGETSE
jgi:hypothetical protein